MTFNVFMTVDRLCSLLMSYYNETVKTEDRYQEGGLDLKATEQKKIRWVIQRNIYSVMVQAKLLLYDCFFSFSEKLILKNDFLLTDEIFHKWTIISLLAQAFIIINYSIDHGIFIWFECNIVSLFSVFSYNLIMFLELSGLRYGGSSWFLRRWVKKGNLSLLSG